jgi:4-amino-4-deoxy-L-arabinose transferase-like glycosyltransferase
MLLAWRLLGAGPAVLGGLLLVLDPFLIGHSRIVQLDGLLTGLTTLAVLCGLVRWAAGGGRGWVLAGGVLSGLALLTKAPAASLAIILPLLALGLGRGRGLRGLGADLALWGVAGLATVLALWPALWVDPVGTAVRVLTFVEETGGRPHSQGNFFLGAPVSDPGPLYYPLSLAFRLTPAALLGLLALAVLPRAAGVGLGPPRQRVALGLVVYVVGFGLFMSLGQKKFDRYVLPVYPALDLLAGLGLWLGLSAARRLRWPGMARVGPAVAGLALIGLMAWPVASVFPHYLTYYSPLLGGGPAAARTILVGYGEGLVDAARWLNLRPDAARLTVVADSHDVLQAAFVGTALPLRDRLPESASYLVVYHYQSQVRPAPSVLAPFRRRPPDQVIRLNGIDYARIYRVMPADRQR